MKSLEELFTRRLVLHFKKSHTYEKVKLKRHYLEAYKDINKIKILVNKEIANNRRIIIKLEDDKIFKKIIPKLFETNVTLQEQLESLSEINILNLFVYNLKKLFQEHEPFLKQKIKRFDDNLKNELRKIKEVSAQIERSKGFSEEKTKIRKTKKIIKNLQDELKIIGSAIGDQPKIKRHSRKVLELIKQLEKTELYGFIKKDVKFIKNKAQMMVKNPKDHKIAYVLGSIYIVSPGTFEMTGVILATKYAGQYTISKGRKIKAFVKKKNDRANVR